MAPVSLKEIAEMCLHLKNSLKENHLELQRIALGIKKTLPDPDQPPLARDESYDYSQHLEDKAGTTYLKYCPHITEKKAIQVPPDGDCLFQV